MTKKMFVFRAGMLDPLYVGDPSPRIALRLALKHFVENELTDEVIESGIMTIPDGEGDVHLLLARVVGPENA